MKYSNENIFIYESLANMKLFGEINLSTTPFYEFKQNGNSIRRFDEDICKGDCFKILKNNIYMNWNGVT
jgi:hypothetical protein